MLRLSAMLLSSFLPLALSLVVQPLSVCRTLVVPRHIMCAPDVTLKAAAEKVVAAAGQFGVRQRLT